jgi:hypothetical protein
VGQEKLAKLQRIGFPPAMSQALSAEFPFVENLPKREKSKLRKVWEELETLRQVSAEKGQLLPMAFAAKLAGVSRQRIYDLCEAGRLESVQINGHPFVTENSLVEWVKTERKAGRPPKVPQTMGEMVKVCVEHGFERGRAAVK